MIKVPKADNPMPSMGEDPMMDNMPPQDPNGMEPNPNGEAMSPMDGQDIGADPMMGDDMSPMGDDNEQDPKKEIQQLTGKLSQSLRMFNQETEPQDTELNKYVAGMILPQASKAMTPEDKAEVIKKMKKGLTDDDMETDDSMSEPMDDSMNQMESKQYLDEMITEILNSMGDDTDDMRKRDDKKINNKKAMGRNPFVANR